jgi:hypothetical protein
MITRRARLLATCTLALVGACGGGGGGGDGDGDGGGGGQGGNPPRLYLWLLGSETQVQLIPREPDPF